VIRAKARYRIAVRILPVLDVPQANHAAAVAHTSPERVGTFCIGCEGFVTIVQRNWLLVPLNRSRMYKNRALSHTHAPNTVLPVTSNRPHCAFDNRAYGRPDPRPPSGPDRRSLRSPRYTANTSSRRHAGAADNDRRLCAHTCVRRQMKTVEREMSKRGARGAQMACGRRPPFTSKTARSRRQAFAAFDILVQCTQIGDIFGWPWAATGWRRPQASLARRSRVPPRTAAQAWAVYTCGADRTSTNIFVATPM